MGQPRRKTEAQRDTRRPQQRRAHSTRLALISAGEVVFSELGYLQTSSKAIALQAGVAVGSLYQYFRNKDELLLEIAKRRATGISQATLAILEDALGQGSGVPDREHVRLLFERLVQVVLDVHRQDPGLDLVLRERRHYDGELARVVDAFEKDLRRRTSVLLMGWGYSGDPDSTALILFAAVEGAVHAQIAESPPSADPVFVSTLVEALVRIAFPHSPSEKEAS